MACSPTALPTEASTVLTWLASPVTEIAVDRYRRLRNVHNLIRRDKTDDIRNPRVSRIIAMTPAHSATNGHVVTDELIVLDNGNEPQAVG